MTKSSDVRDILEDFTEFNLVEIHFSVFTPTLPKSLYSRRALIIYKNILIHLAAPYLPSYMEEGQLCVVCGDQATGLHYRYAFPQILNDPHSLRINVNKSSLIQFTKFSAQLHARGARDFGDVLSSADFSTLAKMATRGGSTILILGVGVKSAR